MTPIRQAGFSVLALVLTLLLFESSTIDLWVQHWLYDQVNHHWLWSKTEPVTKLFLYDGIKGLLIIFAICLLSMLLFGRHLHWVQSRLSGIRIVFLSLLIVPMVVGSLKATTNVACPGGLQQFGGSLPYIKVFEPYPDNVRPLNRQRCFPAAHASGGFALLSLYFLFMKRRNQRLALGFAFALGWLMGGYKMVIGDHFLSHTMITMELTWLLVNIIAFSENYILSTTATVDSVVTRTPGCARS